MPNSPFGLLGQILLKGIIARRNAATVDNTENELDFMAGRTNPAFLPNFGNVQPLDENPMNPVYPDYYNKATQRLMYPGYGKRYHDIPDQAVGGATGRGFSNTMIPAQYNSFVQELNYNEFLPQKPKPSAFDPTTAQSITLGSGPDLNDLGLISNNPKPFVGGGNVTAYDDMAGPSKRGKSKKPVDELMNRINGAKGNLLAGTLTSLLGNALQNPEVKAPIQDDKYLDASIRQVPGYIKDQGYGNIDRSTDSAISNVLANNPLNEAANTIAVVNSQGNNAKGDLAARYGEQDIQLENSYLGAKQQSLDRFNANYTQAQNLTTDNTNAKIGNTAAIGTNYFNEIQGLKNNLNALQDRREIMRSNRVFDFSQLLALPVVDKELIRAMALKQGIKI